MKSFFRFFIPIVIIASILACSFFSKELFVAYAQYKLYRFCKKELGANVTIDSIIYGDKQVFINKVTICKKGHFEWRVNQAILEAHFDFKKRAVVADLALDNVKVIHKRGPQFTIPVTSTFGSWIRYNVHTSVQKGELLLYDYRPHKTLFQQVSFQLDNVYTHKEAKGALSLQLDEGPNWNIQFTKDKKACLSFSSQFQSHNCRRISDLVHYFFDDSLPIVLSSWQLQKGVIQGDILAKFKAGEIAEFSGAITLKEIAMVDPCYSFTGSLHHFHSEFSLDFIQGHEMWFASCKITEGNLSLKEGGTPLWNHLFDVTNLNAEIVIDKGSVVSSLVHGELMGMQGKMNLHFGARDKLMRAFFTGNSSQIIPLLPACFQNEFATAFAEDLFSLNVVVKRAKEGVKLEGSLDITASEQTNTIEFGCHFKKESILSKLDEFPSLLPRALASFLDNMKMQFYLNNRRVGWFKATNIALEKYLSPFLFKNTRFDLAGNVNVEATFDEKGIVFFYEGSSLILENPAMKLTVDRIAERSFSDIVALHFVDLESFEHKGVLPIKSATYLQKNLGLNFKECDGLVTFENDKIRVQNIHTECEGVDFLGELLLQVRSLTDVDLLLQTDKISSTVSAAEHFLSHITSSVFWKLPIKGEIESGAKGCQLQFHFTPFATLVDAWVKGSLKGSLQNSLFSLEEIETDFNYQQRDHSCSFANAKAIYKSFVHKTPFILKAPVCILSHFPQKRLNLELEALDNEGNKRVITAISGEDQTLLIRSSGFPSELMVDLNFGSSTLLSLGMQYGKIHATGMLEKEKANYLLKDLLIAHDEFGEVCLCGDLYSKGEIELQKINFKIREEGLSVLTQYFSQRGINFDLRTLVKEKVPLEGTISCKIGKDLLNATLALQGGECSLYNYRFPLERLKVRVDLDSFTKDTLICTLSDKKDSDSSFTTTWKKDELGKWLFLMGEGSFFGMSGKVVSSDSILHTEIAFEPKNLTKFITLEKGNFLKKMDGRYLFKGDIFYDQSKVDCVGNLLGRECSFDHVKCAFFSSKIKKIGEQIELSEINLQDRAGTVRCKQLLFNQEEEMLFIDKVTVEKLRLASLRSKWTPQLNRRPLRSLVVSNLIIDHLEGNINNIDSITAEGQLTFTNLPKRTFLNQLFFLPIEITARLGLDMANFVPVRGKIFFALKEGRVILQEFNDMYSEGKRSLFYLAQGLPSFIDFSGNLNIYIKMKQYTLLMKLAEFLTLSVKGTLQKPSFTFMTQFDEKS